MPKPNNAAARLLRLLEEVTLSGRMADHRTLRLSWAAVLGVGREDIPSLFQALADVQRLVANTRREIESASDLDQNLLLENFSKIEQFVAITNLEAQTAQQESQYLDVITMRDLKHTAIQLSRSSAEEAVSDEELAELSAEIDALVDSARKANIDSELRAVLLEMLESIRHAISRYRVRGAEAFREALVTCLGEMSIFRETLKTHRDQPLVGRFASVLHRTMQFANRANKLLDLVLKAHEMVALIGPGVIT
jgi:hypothetical protein